jgi:8-oxo-dGTP pyrophosphatase MutT (NUDIX family)
MTLGVRAAVENTDGQVFMVRHTYTKGWFLPGGGVERGQTAIDALRQELVEEGGISLTTTPELIGIYSNHAVFKNDHVLLYRIRAGEWTPVKATSRGEIAETAWIDPLAPPEDITKGNANRLRELYQNAPQTAHW